MKRFILSLGTLGVLASIIGLGVSGCRPKAEAPVLQLFIWEEYIDPEVLAEFEKETGIKVVESNYGSNEEMLAKVQASGGGYDLVVPSDYAVQLMARQGLLAPLDKAKLPNLQHLNPRFSNPVYDPGLQYSVPYLWGMTGIAYLTDRVDPAPESWAALFDPVQAAKYAGLISILDDNREALGCALLYLGLSPNSTDPVEIRRAGDVLRAQKAFVQKYDSESFEDSLAAGSTVLIQGWSGETIVAQGENENVRFVLPREGALLFVDNIAILASSKQQDAAMALINFLNRPDIAARICNFVMYATPNQAALPEVDAALRNSPVFQMPPPERTHMLLDLGDEVLQVYEQVWSEVKGL